MKRAILICLCLIASLLWAGNSIFSYDGFPIQYYGLDVYGMGMGDTGSSDIFRFNSGYGNPAQFNRSNKTLFGTGIILGYTGYKSEYQDQERSFRDNSLDFPYFSVSVPVKGHRFGFQFNSYATGLVENQIILADSTLERQSTDKYIYRADLIYSYNYRDLSLGVSGNYFFGHDKRSFEQFAPNATVPTTESVHRDFKNPTITMGAIQSYGDHALGLHATLPVTLEGESRRRSFHTSEDPQDYEYELPMMMTMSYTGHVNEQIKVTSDISVQRYSDVSDDLQDSWKAGIGMAYEPKEGRQKHWWAKIPLRAGYSFRNLPFKTGGDFIEENTFTAGLSLPLKNEINRLDLAFQYQTRGSLDNNGQSENAYMMMIGFTGFDIISRAIDRTAPRDIPKAEELRQW